MGDLYNPGGLNSKTITGGNGITVSNGNGAAGNPTLAVVQPSPENRLINGEMIFDQRNEGATFSNNTTGTMQTDRWLVRSQTATSTVQQVSDAPAGYLKSLKVTVGTGASPTAGQTNGIYQRIEGCNMADMQMGTANAKAFMLTFWAKSSLTGTFSVGFVSFNASRSYIATYSLPNAGTWTYVALPIPADVAVNTWLFGPNTIGMQVTWSLGDGSNFQSTAGSWQTGTLLSTSGSIAVIGTTSATFQLTGARLFVGTVDTAYTPRAFQQELALCQRHYAKTFSIGVKPVQNVASVVGCITVKNPIAAGDPEYWYQFPVTMMAAPTVVTYNPSAGNANWRNVSASADVTVEVDSISTKSMGGVSVGTSGTVATLGQYLAIHLTAEAEL